jgi:hypothetical protein
MHVTGPKDQERGFIHAFLAGTYEQLVACRDRWGSLNRSRRVADRDGMRCMAAGGSSATVPGGTYVREPRRGPAGTVLSATAHPAARQQPASDASTFCRRPDRRSAAPSYGDCCRLTLEPARGCEILPTRRLVRGTLGPALANLAPRARDPPLPRAPPSTRPNRRRKASPARAAPAQHVRCGGGRPSSRAPTRAAGWGAYVTPARRGRPFFVPVNYIPPIRNLHASHVVAESRGCIKSI